MTVKHSDQVVHLTEYELRHLAEHLEASGRVEELHRLLALETSEQQNLWYEEKNAFGDAAGFVADVVRAWQLADKTYCKHNDELSGRIIGLQIRYALILASINSFAINVPAELVPSLVVNGIWIPEQALAYVHQIPHLNQQSATLIELAPHLPQSLVIEEITRVYGISDEKLRVKTLSGLIPCLPDNQYYSALEELLSILQQSSDDALQRDVLERLAPNLPKTYLEQALAIARGIDTLGIRMEALRSIAPYLPEPERSQVWKEALADWDALSNSKYRTDTIAELAPHLPSPLLKNSLRKAKKILDNDWWKKVFAEISPFLSPPRLQEALIDAREIRSHSLRAEALIALAPHLPERERLSVLKNTLVAVKKI
ncbi:MAG: hypothetical protein QNK24_07600, partial [Desulfuromusa sp.]|nr:hypothetical protein [Desulfuromusa sp.]